jgi:hypothetical protein
MRKREIWAHGTRRLCGLVISRRTSLHPRLAAANLPHPEDRSAGFILALWGGMFFARKMIADFHQAKTVRAQQENR